MKRRTLLSLGGVAAVSTLAAPLLRRRAFAAPFGQFPSEGHAALLPPGVRAERVLEIFLYGGLSPWETLYYVPGYGAPDDPQFPDTQYHALADATAATIAACGVPEGEPLGRPFAPDAAGVDVELGPLAYRLRALEHLTARMRLVVQRHALEPHEAAVPQALTGKPVGQPSAAGLGAHVQRYFRERGDAGHPAPLAYLFATGGIAGDNVSAAASTGLHPGAARPLQIKVDNAARLSELLARGAFGTRAARDRHDALLATYLEQYRDRLRWRGAGEPVRSRPLADLAVAAGSVADVDAIAAVMDPSVFAPRGGAACGDERGFDVPGVSLEAARHLLTHPERPARYVCVSDVGLREASGGGGYDTHTDNAFATGRNFDNVVRGLDAIVNRPGETDPAKLDLDTTLVVLNTEFGRTPWRQGGGDGRNHHPYGYVTAFIGGPIGADAAGIYGAIGPDGDATEVHATPAENRIAALLALGIWPFSPEAFAVSDVRGATSEDAAAASVLERLLGVPS